MEDAAVTLILHLSFLELISHFYCAFRHLKIAAGNMQPVFISRACVETEYINQAKMEAKRNESLINRIT